MSFLDELKQRRVIRVLAGYLVAAWVAIEVSSTIAPLVGVSDWLPRAVLVLAAAGLAPIVLLAWFFDWDRGSGIRRAPTTTSSSSPRRRVAVWAVGGVATLLFAAVGFGAGVRWSGGAAGDAPRRVVVGVFENRTGDESLAPLGQMAADWVTQGLMEAGFIEVADPQTALAVQRAAAVAGAVPADVLGREAQAGLVVRGSYYRTGDSIRINSEVLDVADGRVVAALPPVAAPRSDPLSGVEQVRQRVVTALALQVDRSLESFEVGRGRPPSYAAYGAYMEGLKDYLGNDYPAAAAAFDQAIALDSTFDSALIWAAHAYWFGQTDTMDARLASAEPRRARMTPYDRARLDWMLGFRNGDFERIYQASRAVVAAAPGSANARRELALAAMRTRRYAEARRVFDSLYPFVGLMRAWSERYRYYTELLHLQEDYDREAEVATEGERAGGLDANFARLVRARAAAGRHDGARARAIVDSIADPSGYVDAMIGRELVGHGVPGGEALLRRALEGQPGASPDARFGVWAAAYTLGRYDAADSLLEPIEREIDEFWVKVYVPAFHALVAQRRDMLAGPSYDGARSDSLFTMVDSLVARIEDDWWLRLSVRGMGFVQVAAMRGDSAKALALLRTVSDVADGRTIYLHNSADPDLASLRGWPPFERLIHGVDR